MAALYVYKNEQMNLFTVQTVSMFQQRHLDVLELNLQQDHRVSTELTAMFPGQGLEPESAARLEE